MNSNLVHIDEVDLPGLAKSSSKVGEAKEAPLFHLILVDHNKLCDKFKTLGPYVSAIVDHHDDKGLYPWVTPGSGKRDIAFGEVLEEEPGGAAGGGLDPVEFARRASRASVPSSVSSSSLDSSLSISRSISTVGQALVASTCTLVAGRVRTYVHEEVNS